jgi:hypothetical protein
MNERVTEQPAPIPNGREAVWNLVMRDMGDRDGEGRRKYGTPLKPFNGRDALVDCYQEALDLVVYLRQFQAERAEMLAELESIRDRLIEITAHRIEKFSLVRRLETVMRWMREGGQR